MKKMIITIMMVTALIFTLQSCQNKANQESYTTEWLGESKQEIFENIEEQFQGFSRTMMETSYRYHELYWAGMDQNWDYVEYQREHIVEAIDQGFVRRPEHKQSAQQFLNTALPAIGAAGEAGSLEQFLTAFTGLTASCNTCHAMEEVPFMIIKIPRERHTTVYYN